MDELSVAILKAIFKSELITLLDLIMDLDDAGIKPTRLIKRKEELEKAIKELE
jgi:hypothetical protein